MGLFKITNEQPRIETEDTRYNYYRTDNEITSDMLDSYAVAMLEGIMKEVTDEYVRASSLNTINTIVSDSRIADNPIFGMERLFDFEIGCIESGFLPQFDIEANSGAQ